MQLRGPPAAGAPPRTHSHTLAHTSTHTSTHIYTHNHTHTQIPVAIIGIIAFKEASSPKNLASIALGLAAGVLFVVAKTRGG